MHYYSIVPLIKISLSSSQHFTYQHSEKIKLGSLVTINIAGRKRLGVVIGKTKKPSFFTKPIDSVEFSNLLTKKQLSLANLLAEYYLTPLGTTLKFFVPKVSKTKAKKQQFKTKKGLSGVVLTKQQKAATEKIEKTATEKASLLFGPASSGKTEIILELIRRVQKKSKQSLVLLPELFLSQQEIERYSSSLRGLKICFYHSGCKPSEKKFIYDAVKNGKMDLVISTRMGVFLPFKNLGFIAVDEEQDPSFKQWDQMPHYHARFVSLLLKKQFEASLVFVSATPSFETVHATEEKNVQLVRIPRLSKKGFVGKKPKITIVNILKYYKKKNSVVLSDELIAELGKVLKKNQIGLLLVPRKGKSSGLLCSSCLKMQRCPACGSSIIHIRNKYRCSTCSLSKGSFPSCGSCKSFKLVDVGFGTEKISGLLKTRFPHAKIITADGESLKSQSERSLLFKKISGNKVDFVVGTNAISKGFDIPHICLAAIINADNWAGKMDFRFDERWTGNIFQLAGRVNRPTSKHPGEVIVQTFSPPRKFESLKKMNWLSYAYKELLQRKEFGYPPYAKMIKLTFKNSSKIIVEKNVKTLYTWFLEAHKKFDLRVFEPYYGYSNNVRGVFQKNLLFSYHGEIHKQLESKLKKLPAGWTIDKDPEFIF